MLIKIDLLSVEGLDKIHTCLDLLCDYGYIERQPTLKETYLKYLDIYSLERKDPEMWKMVWNHKIQSLFQMEQQSGIQGIAIAKPKSVDELAVLNSVIRLMAPDKDSETPLETWAKYRKNINLWYQEMRNYGLTEEEISWLSSHSAITEGICESQEGLMSLVQEERLGGHNLNFADKCRKALAKKIGSLFDECEKIFFETLEEKNCSQKLGHYVWDILLRVQRGYSFNRSHCLAYSLVALQEMNLAFRYPIIFWNCACLITDSGGVEDQEETEEGVFSEEQEVVEDIYEPEDFEEYEYEDAPDKKTKIKKKRTKTTDYKKIATAISKMKQSGINVVPPNINTSTYTFSPDVENNQILFGLSGLLNVGEDVIMDTIKNRPYVSIKDYYYKVKPNKRAMISLIKAGAFDSMEDRKFAMAWFIYETCDRKSNLTLQNMPTLIKLEMLPEDTEERVIARRVYEFNRYLKSMCKYDAQDYKLDERAINFLIELEKDNLIQENCLMNIKQWDKVYQKQMDVFRAWITSDKKDILEQLNGIIFQMDWDKYAKGTISAWEMEALCYYYHEHELSNVNRGKYGFMDFYDLPEEPVIERSFTKGGKTINMFKLTKICGTCIAKDKNKGHVILLTCDGVVTVKLRKEVFSIYDRQISERQSDGTKKVLEKGWFTRGNLLLVQGIRSGDNFIAKKYANTGLPHTVMKIDKIFSNGDISLQTERIEGQK